MKLRINNTVYLQKYDVGFITHEISSMPSTLLGELFSKEDMFVICSSSDSLQFSNYFDIEDNVEWLMRQDWILDLNEYINKPITELELIHEKYETEVEQGKKEFEKARMENAGSERLEEIRMRVRKTIHKMHSIETLLDARKGKIRFSFPDGYEGELTPEVLENVSENMKKQSGFIYFFKRLLNRSAQ